MAFCRKCGNELTEGAVFCGKCGARDELPVQKQVITIRQEPARRSARPGLGQGIASLILNIFGIAYAAIFLMITVKELAGYGYIDFFAIIVMAFIAFALSVAGTILASVARKKGNRSNATKASLLLGIIGIGLFIVLFFIFAIYA